MAKDLDRLWERNLGRDDRVCGRHGRECLYPFLDEGVSQNLAKLTLDQVCDLTKTRGYGDKLILRQLAHRLGLTLASGFEKRAIQFGSRSAQLGNILSGKSNRESKGTDLLFSENSDLKVADELVHWAIRKTVLRLCYDAGNTEQRELLGKLMDQGMSGVEKKRVIKGQFGDWKAKMRKNPIELVEEKLTRHDWKRVLEGLHISY